jgi:hypothetical protein
MLGVPCTCAGPWPLLLCFCHECEFVVFVAAVAVVVVVVVIIVIVVAIIFIISPFVQIYSLSESSLWKGGELPNHIFETEAAAIQALHFLRFTAQ